MQQSIKNNIFLPCFTTTEQDIIDKLESVPNKSGYIKRLIRADIAADKERQSLISNDTGEESGDKI